MWDEPHVPVCPSTHPPASPTGLWAQDAGECGPCLWALWLPVHLPNGRYWKEPGGMRRAVLVDLSGSLPHMMLGMAISFQ